MRKLILFSLAFTTTLVLNAQTWSALGAGVNQQVNCLALYSDSLYAGGDFTFVNGTTTSAHYIAKWNGTTWSPLGSALNNTVSAMITYNNELYVGGNFTTAGGNTAKYIARWNGTSWSSVGSGLNQRVYSLAVYNGELYVGGDFTIAGGVPSNYIAKWNGTTWSNLGSGVNGATYHTVRAMAVYNSELVVGGTFSSADGNPVENIAKWDGTIFSYLNIVNNGPNLGIPAVLNLLSDDTTLYLGGSFTNPGGIGGNIGYITANTYGRIGGGVYTSVGTTVVTSLAVYNNELYLGGNFTQGNNGPVATNKILKWTGGNSWTSQGWVTLGNGITGGTSPKVNALLVYNNELYVGGAFTTAGTISAKNIAKWSIGTLDVKESTEHNNITIYPNPAKNNISVKIDTKLIGSVYTVYDNSGKLLMSGQLNTEHTVIEVDNLTSGIYLFSIGENMRETFKVIKE